MIVTLRFGGGNAAVIQGPDANTVTTDADGYTHAKEGFVFSNCYLTAGPATYQSITLSTASGASLLYTPSAPSANMFNGNFYMGRASSGWSRIVYLNTYFDANVNAAGWKSIPSGLVAPTYYLLGEHNSTGPGSLGTRATFGTVLSDAIAAKYAEQAFLGDVSFIDANYIATLGTPPPAPVATTTQSSGSVTTQTSTPVAVATLLVAPVGYQGVPDFNTLTDALNSIPSDGARRVISVAPGTYTEQVRVKVLNLTIRALAGQGTVKV
ncbi:hypothetical protein HKX48_007084 [Thoreauomyces humboldtii]|nr:hypothetical protein HKX48_007084 [Thoreauomyces humboldtii]